VLHIDEERTAELVLNFAQINRLGRVHLYESSALHFGSSRSTDLQADSLDAFKDSRKTLRNSGTREGTAQLHREGSHRNRNRNFRICRHLCSACLRGDSGGQPQVPSHLVVHLHGGDAAFEREGSQQHVVTD
jgi:hypothetical protein